MQTADCGSYFPYEGSLPVIELNASGAVTAVNTFGANGLLSRNSGGTSVYYTFDERGNVCQRHDSSFNVLSTDLYDAFGVGQRTPSGQGASEPWGFGSCGATVLELTPEGREADGRGQT